MTPDRLAALALKWGDRTHSNGTAWSFFDHAAKEFDAFEYRRATSLAALEKALNSGGSAVASMGKGYWTTGGHYRCVKGLDGAYVYANDPASEKRKKQKTDDFMRERRMFFCYIPKPTA